LIQTKISSSPLVKIVGSGPGLFGQAFHFVPKICLTINQIHSTVSFLRQYRHFKLHGIRGQRVSHYGQLMIMTYVDFISDNGTILKFWIRPADSSFSLMFIRLLITMLQFVLDSLNFQSAKSFHAIPFIQTMSSLCSYIDSCHPQDKSTHVMYSNQSKVSVSEYIPLRCLLYHQIPHFNCCTTGCYVIGCTI